MKLVKDTELNEQSKKVSDDEALEAFRTILSWMGEDPSREGLVENPKKSFKSLQRILWCYNVDANKVLEKTFGDVEGYDDMVVEKYISY